MNRKPELLEVVLAAGPPASLAGLLDGWQQQADEHADDRNHYQKLDQRKARRKTSSDFSHWFKLL